MPATLTLRVRKIEVQEDRVLLFAGPSPSDGLLGPYHVIATPSQAEDVRVGDFVKYTPMGINFGYFVSVKSA